MTQCFVYGQHFLLQLPVWCQHFLRHTQLFSHQNRLHFLTQNTLVMNNWSDQWGVSIHVWIFTISLAKCEWSGMQKLDVFHSNVLLWQTFPELWGGSRPRALTLAHSVPAERLPGASYYRSHHLLHPTGPPSWRPAPTSLLLLHLSKATKTEKDMSHRHNPDKQNRGRQERSRGKKMRGFGGRK